MSTREPGREPTRDELLAMAYVDGELSSAGRAELERRMAASAELRREVSALKELELLARAAAPREPIEHEWAALAREPLQRGTLGLGWILLVIGFLGLALLGLWKLCASAAPLALKLLVAATILGGALLLGATLRARLRTLPLDPYRKVQR
jgi:anti-sigma factor RsiW